MNGASMSFGIAFVGGLASFLSPCVLPIVPSYVSYVTGLTLDELRDGGAAARRQAAIHSGLFILGFSLLFIGLGASATALGQTLSRLLPLFQQVGGVVVIVFGLYMLGLLKLPALMRERRLGGSLKPVGKVGSVVAGVAFGAGWTPCVGPVLASILLYAGMQGTMLRGMLLLSAYSLGLALPFFASAVAFNWTLTRLRPLRRWLGPLERATGAFLVVLGLLLFTGRFAALSGFFANFGQLLHLES